jgi:hypothetical protein
VKFLRILLSCFVLVLALAAVLVALAFAPVVQTWVAQAILARQPAFQGSLGSLSARFGRVEVSELQLKIDGAVLTIPSLEAELPLVTALRERKLPLRRLVAKGWTLDLRQAAAPNGTGEATGSTPAVEGGPAAPAPAEVKSPQEVVRIFRGILSRWALPCDVSLDGADLEGEIVVAAPLGSAPARVHVIIKGGGMAAGRDGDFAVDASTELVDSELSVVAIAGHGHLIVAMKSPRTFGRIEFKGDCSAEGGPFPNGITFLTDVTAAVGAGEESYSVDLSRGSQHLATIFARWAEDSSQLAGTWKVDLQDSDVALFTLDRPLPRFTAKGEGQYDTDIAFTRAHALGHLSGGISNLSVLEPSLDRLGAVNVDTSFDAAWSGRSIRVDRLSASLSGTGPAVVLQSLQPFEVEVPTGDLKPADPAGNWMEIAVRGFPLAWLSTPEDRFVFSGGDATGEFIVRTDKGAFTVCSKSPVTAAGVSVQRANKTFGPKLDLAISLLADYGPQGWHFQAAPLVINSGGSRLATLDAKASQPSGPDQPIAMTGTWSADLPALASKAMLPNAGWISGRSASGDFSATLGTSMELDGKLAVVGHDEHHSLTASGHVEVGGDGRISFQGPVKIEFGPGVSNLSAEGTLIRDEEANRLYVKLTAKDVVLEHLRLIAASLAAAGGAPQPASAGPETPAKTRDRIPFWGNWAGRVAVAFDRVSAGDRVFGKIGGVFQVDHGSVRLEDGQGEVAGQRFTNVKGALSFDDAGEFPYDLKATAAMEKVDAATLFPVPEKGGDPVIEGQYSIACTLSGNGIGLVDLVGRAQEEFRLTSTAGIVRLFKTDLDEAMPQEVDTPVGDTLGRLGTGVGRFFGADDSVDSFGKRNVSPTAETVIRFINDISEIGYDQITLTATRGPDGAICLADIVMTAGDERLTGSGQIAGAKDLSIRARPLSVDLQFWGRGRIAKRLSKVGLLSTQKDDHGYTLLNQPVHLGGTLEHIDMSQWHKLLVKAALQTPDVPKKAP